MNKNQENVPEWKETGDTVLTIYHRLSSSVLTLAQDPRQGLYRKLSDRRVTPFVGFYPSNPEYTRLIVGVASEPENPGEDHEIMVKVEGYPESYSFPLVAIERDNVLLYTPEVQDPLLATRIEAAMRATVMITDELFKDLEKAFALEILESSESNTEYVHRTVNAIGREKYREIRATIDFSKISRILDMAGALGVELYPRDTRELLEYPDKRAKLYGLLPPEKEKLARKVDEYLEQVRGSR